MTVGDNWREIVDPNFYSKAGWPSEWVDKIRRKHETINGVVYGVWHLEFLRALGESLGVKQKPEIGAYSEAKYLCREVWLEIIDLERGKSESSKNKADKTDE